MSLPRQGEHWLTPAPDVAIVMQSHCTIECDKGNWYVSPNFCKKLLQNYVRELALFQARFQGFDPHSADFRR